MVGFPECDAGGGVLGPNSGRLIIATSNNHNQLMIGKYLPCKFLGSDVAFWNSKSSEASDEELFPADSVENVLSIEKVHALLLSRPMHNLNTSICHEPKSQKREIAMPLVASSKSTSSSPIQVRGRLSMQGSMTYT